MAAPLASYENYEPPYIITIPPDVLERYQKLGRNAPDPVGALAKEAAAVADLPIYTFHERPRVRAGVAAEVAASHHACGLIHVLAALLQPQCETLAHFPVLLELLTGEVPLHTQPAFAALVQQTTVLEGNLISKNSIIVRLQRDNAPVLFNVLDQSLALYQSCLALAQSHQTLPGRQAMFHNALRDAWATVQPQLTANPPGQYSTWLGPLGPAAGVAAPYNVQLHLQALNAWASPDDVYLLISQILRYNFVVHDRAAIRLLAAYQLLELCFPLCFWDEIETDYVHRFATSIPVMHAKDVPRPYSPFW